MPLIATLRVVLGPGRAGETFTRLIDRRYVAIDLADSLLLAGHDALLSVGIPVIRAS
jgi:hypothetical protein